MDINRKNAYAHMIPKGISNIYIYICTHFKNQNKNTYIDLYIYTF